MPGKTLRDFIDKESVGILLDQLATELAEKIANQVYGESSAYTLADVVHLTEGLLLELPKLLRPGSAAWDSLESIVDTLHQQHKVRLASDESYAGSIAECRRCHKETRRDQLLSGTLEKSRGYTPYLVDYFLLCSDCAADLGYECQGLTLTCTLCTKRHAPLAFMSETSRQLQKLGVSERIRNEICVDCLTLPGILKVCKGRQGHMKTVMAVKD